MKILFATMIAFVLVGCDAVPASPPQSATGVKKATANVQVQANGLTIEQENIQRRMQEDNKPGSLKHLYVISSMSGDVLLYSTVKGKVTSSGKRLTPYEVAADDGEFVDREFNGFPVQFGDRTRYTGEVLQDDGTYGSSAEYIYWWDSKSVYHQHYVTGGQIVHVSNAPMRVGRVVINVDAATE